MANQAEKRRIAANEERLGTIWTAILVSNSWYIVMRLLVFERYLTWFHYVAFLAANGVYYLAYRILNNAARPTYSAADEVVYGGTDLKTRGFLEYVHDAIIFTIILQFLGGFTDWAWILVLIAPGYAIYVGVTYYLQLKAAQKKQWDNMGVQERKTKLRNRREQRRGR